MNDGWKKTRRIVPAAFATCLLIGGATAQDDPDPRSPPTRIDREAATKLQPVAPPDDFRRVAVLEIRLDYAEGRVRGAELVSAKRIPSIAPKVFARQGGDWEVFLLGEGPDRSFLVFDPGFREAEVKEGGDADGKAYEWIGPDGPVDWRLVVPLYADGKALDVRGVRIVDRRSGDVVLESEL